MIAFQRAAPCSIWIHGWWDSGFIRFQLCFVHALSHCQCNKFCPKQPKSAQIRNFEIPPKIKILVFLKYKISTCRGGTRACFHHLDFQSKNFSYTIFIIKKRPLYMNFSIPHCGNWWFSQGSTPCVSMRFCGHLPNSPKNKNPKRHISYLLEKVVFLDPKRLLSPSGRGKKKNFFNFECYDLANGMECEYKIW
jgi:hypothetical protein